MVVGIEKKKNGVSTQYGRVIEIASKVNLVGYMLGHVVKDVNVKTDFWGG